MICRASTLCVVVSKKTELPLRTFTALTLSRMFSSLTQAVALAYSAPKGSSGESGAKKNSVGFHRLLVEPQMSRALDPSGDQGAFSVVAIIAVLGDLDR